MSSFLVDKKVYQKVYESIIDLHNAGIIYIYADGENINDYVFNGFKELQKENFKTVESWANFDGEIKNKNIKIERKYKSKNIKELTQVYKNLQCIKYQIETEYKQDFINHIMRVVADALIRSSEYYEDCDWGDFINA